MAIDTSDGLAQPSAEKELKVLSAQVVRLEQHIAR